MRPISRSLSLILLTASILPSVVHAAPREPDYPCYLRTASGRVIDLGSMCRSSGAIAPAIPSSTPLATAPQKSAIEFAGWRITTDKYGVGTASGQITNSTKATIIVSRLNLLNEGSVIRVVPSVQVKAGETKEVKEVTAISNIPSANALIPDNAVSWQDGAGEVHETGFAACQYVSNVNEAEKHCSYH